MKLKRILASTICLSTLALVGCSSSKEKAENAYPVVTNAPSLEEGQYAVVQFAPGDNTLTEESKAKIKNVVDSAEGQGKDIENIKILTWSDTDTTKGAVPTEFDRSIASERSEAIEEYLKEDLKTEGDYKDYNMAEKGDINKVVQEQNWKRQPFSKAESRTLSATKTEDLDNLMENSTSKALVVVDYD